MAVPKWDENRTNQLVEIVGDNTPITQGVVASAAEALETSVRSVSSKLRKMGYEVESAVTAKAKKFSDEEEAALADYVEGNAEQLTYGEIAEDFAGGKFRAKEIQGKILSMELTSKVKPTPKKEVEKRYTEAEEDKFLSLVADGAYMENIAKALGKKLPSIRGKALSFLRTGKIEAMPKQKTLASDSKKDALSELGDAVKEMTVAEIAEKIEKSERGVRTMLTRRGITASDYDGAARKAKLTETE